MKRVLIRLILPVSAVLMFVVLTQVFNVFAGLTPYKAYLIRRLAATVGLGTLLLGPAVVMRARVQAGYLAVVSGILGMLLIANTVYSSYAGGFLSASTFSYLWQVGSTGGSIVQLFRPVMLCFLVPAVIFGVVAWRPKWGGGWLKWERLGTWGVVVVSIGLLAVAFVGYGSGFYKEWRQWGDVSRLTTQPYDARELVEKVGIINYNLFDTIKYVNRRHPLSAAEVAFVEKERGEQVTPSGANAATGELAGRNVIFLQLESFQEFLIGMKVNGREVTPNLNKLAAESRRYSNFNYSIGPGTSSDAEFTTFNSLLPLANQSVVFDYPTDAYRAYPDELRKNGYSTSAYHAHTPSFWNRGTTFPVFGFDEYVTAGDYKTGEVAGFGLNDRDFLDQTADKLTKLKQPFYAHPITLTSHSPFKIPEKDQTLDLSGVKLAQVQKDYLESVHYSDVAIGEFMAKLEKNGLKNDKLALFVMGDHEGFVFGSADRDFAKVVGQENGFDDLTYQAARTIPFLIFAPGSGMSGTDNRAASQIDVYPTLINLLGLKKPDTVLGVDLFSDQMPTVVHRSRGLGASVSEAQRGNRLFVADSMSGGPACYEGPAKVETRLCDGLREFAVTRALMSDDVIKGNRIDLLEPAK